MTKLGSRKLHFPKSDRQNTKKKTFQKVTRVGSIIGQKIDYNGVGALRGQRHISSKHLTQVQPRTAGNVCFELLAYIAKAKFSYSFPRQQFSEGLTMPFIGLLFI